MQYLFQLNRPSKNTITELLENVNEGIPTKIKGLKNILYVAVKNIDWIVQMLLN